MQQSFHEMFEALGAE